MADGQQDLTFPITNTGIEPVAGSLRAIYIQPSGSIIIGGDFDVVNGVAAQSLTRILGSGTLPANDVVPPITSAEFSTPANANGWNNMNTTVTLSAVDEAGGSGVYGTTYSVSGAQTVPTTTALSSSVLITVNTEGITAVTFYATDVAGNPGVPQSISVRLDKTAPVISITTPPNGIVYQLGQSANAVYGCSDGRSGILSCVGTTANGSAVDTSTGGSKTFTVNAVDLAGNSSIVTNVYSVNVPAPIPPNPPTNLTATATSATQVNLAWSDNSTNETGFKIERCLQQGKSCTNYSEIAQVGANVRAFSSTGLAKSTQYGYRVRAYNGTGNSAYSNIATTKTLKR